MQFVLEKGLTLILYPKRLKSILLDRIIRQAALDDELIINKRDGRIKHSDGEIRMVSWEQGFEAIEGHHWDNSFTIGFPDTRGELWFACLSCMTKGKPQQIHEV